MKFNTIDGRIDLASDLTGFAIDNGFESAIIVSLLTDRRANPDDVLPDDRGNGGLIPPDRRGWCGDSLPATDGDRIGSRLWLLTRRKVTEETRRDAISYAREALQWMIEDGHATEVGIEAEWALQDGVPGRLNMLITPVFSDGTSETYTVSTPIGV